ncbi:SGNH/GDSL hydrolase family protein [Vulcaniibacterium tengchongense]|uniref:Lysophospholipase L1-like esterase n=1 Tax=Vulcaniibacterium tengchongense TaxID=1273429 RepID=A0A3N4VJW2_9GAMM|nr:SGNH/GDSL hydrolase family protein [Vulcaniibacterium tengchongense]RPE77307.1 lysophospholipase L1-like esterase [Vulcaniibacterium tengchongense]
MNARIRFPAWSRLPAWLLVAALALPLPAAARAPQPAWIPTWTASPQPRWDGDFALPTQLPYHFWNQTVRQVARVSLGGRRVRVLLSNQYGDKPLKIGAARIALAGEGGAIVPGSDRALTFGGRAAATVPPGAPLLSDPVELEVPALARVAVSLYLPEPTPPSTFHWDARQTAYVGAGDQTAAPRLRADSTLTARVFLGAIQVEAAPGARAVVAFGDSITDGNMATLDADARWPDALAGRLAARNVAVLNAGISGARVLRDKMGENALARFERDVLAQPGVAAVVVLMGINDIAWRGTPLEPDAPPVAAEDLIAGYRQLIARARARGVRIVGATLTPFEGALDATPMRGYFDAGKERVRRQVNAWIRDGGEFDAVLDFDAIVRDPAHPARFLPAYDSGDHLHPGDAGYRAMAQAIDPRVLLGED